MAAARDPFDKVLSQLASGRSGLRQASTTLYDLPLGTVITCEGKDAGGVICNTPVELREMPDHKGRPFRYWSDCPCIGKAADRAVALTAQARALQAHQHGAIVADTADLSAFTFETFDARRLENGAHVVALVRGWLDAIAGLPVAPSYHEKPRACLYLYSAGKGRGKTHLAASALNVARAAGRSAVFVNENDYLESYWAAPLDQRAAISDAPGRRAWLTVIDDMGQRESTGPGMRDAWYDILDPRWLKRGWTIITSNYTPDELHAHGTISAASLSRLTQLCHGKQIELIGTDQRLPAREAA